MQLGTFLGWSSILFLACGLPLVAAAGAEAAERPPNVVIVLADDLGIGDVGCYHRESKIPTPNMDSLAAEGRKFTHAYSAAAVCVPSRYGLLTGRYPFRGAPLAWQARPTIQNGRETLATLLKRNGYATACVGKWHAGFDGGVAAGEKPLTGGPLDRGFDDFFGQHGSLDQPPYFYIRNRRAVEPASETIADAREEGGVSIQYQGRYWRGGRIAPNFKHEEALDRYAEEALKYLRDRAEAAKTAPGEPFFLYLALTAPHGPWLPAEKFHGASRAGPLGDFVVHVDHVVGRVLKALDDGGLRDNTLVILTSDNGPLWFEPDVERWGHDSSGGFRGQKGDIWEGGVRMPFLARWPGKIPSGSESSQLLCHVDLLATLAALLGEKLPAEAGADSFNLLPAFLKEPEKPLRESLVLQSLGPDDLAIRQGPWKLIPWLGSGGFLAPEGTRVVKRKKPSPAEPAGQLYHLLNDPAEEHNLYAEHPEIVSRLSALLKQARMSERTN